MAAFYKYIKGYMSDGETTQYIFFNQGGGHDNRPYFSNKSDASNADYLVSEKGNHTFEGNNTFGVQNEDGTPSNKTTSFLTTVTFTNKTTFSGATEFTANSMPDFQKGIKISDSIKIGTASFSIKNSSDISLLSFSNDKVTFSQDLVSNKSITAQYFNALSDRHLKTNINTIEDSVLPFIISTPVYTFNYKKDPTIPVIGIMAQDVLNKNINDFNLVKKNGNGYYEIKESKMIYILWKAVQEQQKQIEALQARLEGEVNAEAND